MARVANTVTNQPVRYEQLMTRAAAVDPALYFTLAEYCRQRKAEDQAADFFEKGTRLDPDGVRAATHASWLIRYYLKKGRLEDARREADFAGEVFSFPGLQAQGEFFEATSNYTGAFECYSNILDRYGDPGPLNAFRQRRQPNTGAAPAPGASPFSLLSTSPGPIRPQLVQPGMQKVIKVAPLSPGEQQARQEKATFPNGIEKVALGDFHAAPVDGIELRADNIMMSAFGIHRGDVIVALAGIRVHNSTQFNYVRMSNHGFDYDFIVWQGSGYQEIKVNSPGRMTGVSFGDYHAK
jgi:tetratricopeptide (TPR) repeat protein